MATSLTQDASSPFPWIAKDASAVLDYTFDWSAWLGTDTILTATWTVPAGLTKTADTKTGTTTTAWLGGGKPGATYLVRCLITTTDGKSETRTMEIRVVKR